MIEYSILGRYLRLMRRARVASAFAARAARRDSDDDHRSDGRGTATTTAS